MDSITDIDRGLHRAIRLGQVDNVKEILDSTLSDLKPIKLHNLLHLAVSCGQLQVAKTLINDYCCPVNCENKTKETPLHIACSCGHLDIVKLLILEHKADIYARDDEYDDAPLNKAAFNGYTNIVKFLIDKCGCSPDIQGYKGRTILHQACDGGHVELAETLIIDYNLDPMCVDDNGNTPLHIAALSGKEKIVNLLITNHKCPVSSRNSADQTPLHCACWKGHLSVVKLLLSEHNADLIIRDKNKSTPLNTAVLYGHACIVKFLIDECGCSPRIKGYEGRTILHYACDGGHVELAKTLIIDYNLNPKCIDDDRNTPLHIAALSGKEEIVNLLITNHKCPVNSRNSADQTPLHCACYKGHLSVVKLLVSEHNADFSICDKKGNAPLNTAALYGHASIVKFLIDECGCSPRIKGYQGQTILHQTCDRGHVKLAKTLIIDYNLDPISVDDNGNTPLHIAAFSGREVIVNLLITNHKYPVNSRNSADQTPLHRACYKGHLSVIKLLVSEHNAEFCICDKKGNAPLNTAAFYGHASIVKFFIECGCSPSIKGYQGQTILHQTCDRGHVKLAETLIIDYNLDPISVDDNGNTPLHIAALSGKEEIVNLLITNHKCPVNSRNNADQTPLHYACQEGYLNVVNMLVFNDNTLLLSADQDGNTPQHISAKFAKKECLLMVLNSYHAPIYIRNKSGRSVLDVAKDSITKNKIKSYLKQNSDRIHYDYKLIQDLSTQVYNSGGHKLIRVFVIGKVESGKSTLIKALKRDGILSSLNPVSEATVPPHTSGIIPSVHHSKAIGRVIYYDFAGDPEYYSSHSAIVSNIMQSKFGTNIFLVVANLTKSIEAICDELGYWSNFISYHIKEVTLKYKVLVIGSHVDLITDPEAKIVPISQFVQECFSSVSQSTVEVFTLDCRKPRSARSIYGALTKVIQGIIPYSLTMKAAILLGLLEKDFKNVISCTLQTLIEHINETGIYLPNTASSLYPIVMELHSPGLLMIISKPKKLEDSMLFLNISKLTNEVHQRLFSTSKVQSVSPTALDLNHISMGILPQKYLKSILPEYITTDCLVQLQYCQEFTHSEVKLAMKLPENVTADPSFFYFPALCNTEKQKIVTPDRFNYSISWYGKCGKKFDYFPPRFLHVLLLRLAYIFSLPMRHDQSSEESPGMLVKRYNHRCAMWKNGIHWLMHKGVDCFVEMVNNSKGMIVITKSKKEHKCACTEMLFKIVKELQEAKDEFCRTVTLQEYLMNSVDPALCDDEDKLHFISEVKDVLRYGEPSVISVSGRGYLDAKEVEHLKYFLLGKFIINFIATCSGQWQKLAI